MPMRRQALRSIAPLATFLFFSLILIFSLALPSLLAKAEPVTSAAADRVSPDDMNTAAPSLPTEDGGFVQAPHLGTDVIMTVNGTIARVTVTQRFENSSDPDAPQLQATQPSQPDSLAAPRVASTEPLRQIMLFILLMTFLSAATFVAWRYCRRDIASPRRIGRRI